MLGLQRAAPSMAYCLVTTSMVGKVRLSCAKTGAANAARPTAATKALANSRTRHPTRPHLHMCRPPQVEGLHNLKLNSVGLGGKQEPRCVAWAHLPLLLPIVDRYRPARGRRGTGAKGYCLTQSVITVAGGHARPSADMRVANVPPEPVARRPRSVPRWAGNPDRKKEGSTAECVQACGSRPCSPRRCCWRS